jgi:hypothetical protein
LAKDLVKVGAAVACWRLEARERILPLHVVHDHIAHLHTQIEREGGRERESVWYARPTIGTL